MHVLFTVSAALKELVPPLQSRLKSAVEAEQQYEEALIKSLYAKNNLKRLQKDGLVLLGLQVRGSMTAVVKDCVQWVSVVASVYV